LRGRRPGDVLTLPDQTGDKEVKHRKLKKWLIDLKVPQHVRDQLPLLCVDDHIVAILLPDGWHYLAIPYATEVESDKVTIWLRNT
jgi:tRNA(Ile)-lysidine synthetase-like protein